MDARYTSDILGFCTAGTARNGSISSAGTTSTASTRSTKILSIFAVYSEYKIYFEHLRAVSIVPFLHYLAEYIHRRSHQWELEHITFGGLLAYLEYWNTGSIPRVRTASNGSNISGFNTLDTLEYCKCIGCSYCGYCL